MAGGGTRKRGIITDINVTPLVDIMLVLLIIFMLTNEEVTEKMKKPVIEVDLPKATSAQKEPQKPLSIVITKDNSLFVNGDAVNETALVARVKAAVAETPGIEAVVSADRRVMHGTVVRTIDAVRLQGVEHVAINTKEQDIEAP